MSNQSLSVAASPTGPSLPRFGLLLRHGRVELLDVDADAPRLERVLRQVQREAEGIVKLESDVARQRIARFERSGRLVEQLKPARQRLAEADFLEFKRFGDQRLAADKFWIGLPHLARPERAPGGKAAAPSRPADAHGAWRGA